VYDHPPLLLCMWHAFRPQKAGRTRAVDGWLGSVLVAEHHEGPKPALFVWHAFSMAACRRRGGIPLLGYALRLRLAGSSRIVLLLLNPLLVVEHHKGKETALCNALRQKRVSVGFISASLMDPTHEILTGSTA
jgi:hypothetical protein